MGKHKKSKDAEFWISSGKRYLYRTRKILLIGAAALFVLNMSILGIFDGEMRKDAISAILLTVLFVVIQLVDRRKSNWEWVYVILLAAVFFLLSGIGAFVTQLHFMRYLWAGEIVLFAGLLFLLLRKPRKT